MRMNTFFISHCVRQRTHKCRPLLRRRALSHLYHHQHSRTQSIYVYICCCRLLFIDSRRRVWRASAHIAYTKLINHCCNARTLLSKNWPSGLLALNRHNDHTTNANIASGGCAMDNRKHTHTKPAMNVITRWHRGASVVSVCCFTICAVSTMVVAMVHTQTYLPLSRIARIISPIYMGSICLRECPQKVHSRVRRHIPLGRL